MWLLDAATLRLKHFSDDRKAVEERYAILSHTWGEDEVSFRDMTRDGLLDDIKHRKTKKKAGFAKIEKACEQAKKDGYQHVWIDTCCIDKDSSAELSEAINSMYRWYADAAVCYAYLADIVPARKTQPEYVLHSDLSPSRWFKRGWTLQELIAPAEVRFYDANWDLIGNKDQMALSLSHVTGIDERVLRQRLLLKSFSIATRMSWAAHRQTTRVEDEAYSLLGIFDVNMPMIYGEGLKAFQRLQEEIIKTSTDHSIFAWSAPADDSTRPHGKLLAPSPRYFLSAGDLETGASAGLGDSYEISNSGLRISLPTRDKNTYLVAQLNCQRSGMPVELWLKKHTKPEDHSTKRTARNIVCEVDRGLSKSKKRTLQNGSNVSDVESLRDIVILRDSFTLGYNVEFELSPGLEIVESSPAIHQKNAHLSATEPGDFSQGYITVQFGVSGLRERLHFGQFLQRRGAGPTFRLRWARGFDSAADGMEHHDEHNLRFAKTSTTHQSWAQTTGRGLRAISNADASHYGGLRATSNADSSPLQRLEIGDNNTLYRITESGSVPRQRVAIYSEESEYIVCFEAKASLHHSKWAMLGGRAPTPSDELVTVDDLSWRVQIRAILGNVTPEGEYKYYFIDRKY